MRFDTHFGNTIVPLQRQRLDHLAPRPARALAETLRRQGARLDSLQARLQALDPRKVLERGYAWLSQDDGQPITRAGQLSAGQHVQATLADGTAHLVVR